MPVLVLMKMRAGRRAIRSGRRAGALAGTESAPRFALLGLILTSLIACSVPSSGSVAKEMMKLSLPGGERQAILQQAGGPGPHPTLFVLHGARTSAARLARSSGFSEAAAANGFNVVFPEEDQLWDYTEAKTGRDGPFLTALARRLIESQLVDPARLYISGIASGGMMAFAMICRPDSPFAGAATIIAALPASLKEDCKPRQPAKIIMMNGTEDPLVPFAGGKLGFFGRHGHVLGAIKTAKIFAKAEGCTSATKKALPNPDRKEGTHIVLSAWEGCVPGADVRLYKIIGGGHQIPGGPTFVPLLFGRPNHDIKAADVIVKVFAGP